MRCVGLGSVDLESDTGDWYPDRCPGCAGSGWCDWCPVCDGHGDGCERCAGTGWVPASAPVAA